MANNTQVSHQVTKSESVENKRLVPKIFMAMLAAGLVAVGIVLTLGAKFAFH